MALEFPVTIRVDDKESHLQVKSDWTIEHLYDKVALLTNNKLNRFDLFVSFCPLERRDKTIRDYKFSRNEKIELRRRPPLTALQGFFELTSDACSMTEEDDPQEKRVKLSCCGCVLSAEGMDLLCETKLKEGATEFKCPNCGKPLQSVVVRHVLSTIKSAKEVSNISTRLNANFENTQQHDIRRCPSCKTMSTRESPETWGADPNRVTCNICTKKTGRRFEFCWSCEQQWKGNMFCGNSNCDRAARQLKVLATCGTNEMFGVKDCPEIRACPRCGLLLSHIDRCKLVTCTACKLVFCFICLKIAKNHCTAPCTGGVYGACKVADRQTTLPDMWNGQSQGPWCLIV